MRIVTPGPFGFAISNVPGWLDVGIAGAAHACGAAGILDLQMASAQAGRLAIERLRRNTAPFGAVIDASSPAAVEFLAELPPGSGPVILTHAPAEHLAQLARLAREGGRQVWLEATSLEQAAAWQEIGASALVAKGSEAGGAVGEETAFMLLQRLLCEFRLPVWVRGGVGLHSVAACYVAGAAGAVLDSQLLLTAESALPPAIRAELERFDPRDSVCLGQTLGHSFRVCKRPGGAAVDRLAELEREAPADEWLAELRRHVAAPEGDEKIWAIGQCAVHAAGLAARFRTVRGVVAAMRNSLGEHVAAAKRREPLAEGSPFAAALNVRYPILQGPMTRVSDVPAFAAAVAEGGGLPVMALATLPGDLVRRMLAETRELLGDRTWGVGLLGFLPAGHRKEQIDAVREFRPRFAVIAGGRPDQGLELERMGIPAYLHVPVASLFRGFLLNGVRRFIVEGRECGGHVGPHTSFILWDTAIDTLLGAVEEGVRGEELEIVFAGGIHDGRSAAMVAAMAAPLADRGVKIGVLMGTAYLFTREAVSTGAIVEAFQQQALACRQTAVIESGPGYSVRCAAGTPFLETFKELKRRMLAEGMPPEQVRVELEKLCVGRLRIASKALVWKPGCPTYEDCVPATPDEQWQDGMYMIGQAASLHGSTCTIAELHADVCAGSTELLRRAAVPAASGRPLLREQPCDIAVVGMACMLPKAPNLAAFWANTVNRVDAIIEVPEQRFKVQLYYDPDRKARDKIYSRWGGFIDEVPFDPTRYGIPPNALSSIDPMQLLSLVVVDQALHDAGIDPAKMPRERTSVIFGISGGLGKLGVDYAVRSTLPELMEAPPELYQRLPEWTEDSFAGILPNVATGRVANRFDFGGVNFTVDAACASSLAAVYVAARELAYGSSDVVIAGGVDTGQTPFGFLCFSKAEALSGRGASRTFDANADGIAISEGLGAVVLKRLEDAERDGDRVYAVIRGVAGSSDGRGKSMTAPRMEGQALALRRAYMQAGISPSAVSLVEAHGTGTVVGDSTELDTLAEVLASAGARPRSCAVGSAKSMVGHTKSAAGVTGLIRTALSLYHKVLPPTAHVQEPNKKLRDASTPLYLNVDAQPWIPEPGAARCAGVSSFGFGGTNFHAVLEEHSDEAAGLEIWPAELFAWRADSLAALAGQLKQVAGALESTGAADLRELAASAARRLAPAHPDGFTLAIVAGSTQELAARLDEAGRALAQNRLPADDPAKGVYSGHGLEPGKIAFLFPGQGSQHPGMLRELALAFPEFRQRLAHADRVLAGRHPRRLSAYIYPPAAFTPEERDRQMRELTDTAVAQPALGVLEIALSRLLERLGVRPDMTAGHSYGEYVALCAADRFPEETLFRISEARGRAINEGIQDDPGAMAAVAAGQEAVGAALDGSQDVVIANLNSPRQTIISGPTAAVRGAAERLQSAGLTARMLPVACAFHSQLMQPAREKLAATLAAVRFTASESNGTTRVFSNTLGGPYPENPAEVAGLLAEHLVRPVRFAEEVRSMYEAGARIFIETGPKGVLSGLARDILDGTDAWILQTDMTGRSGIVQLLHVLARLAALGVDVKPWELLRGRVDDVRARVRQPVRASQPGWMVTGNYVRPKDRPVSVEPPIVLRAPAVAPAAVPAPLPAPPAAPALPQVPGTADAVMAQFQRLMSEFLSAQTAVMTAYLQGTPAAPAPAAFATLAPAAAVPAPAAVEAAPAPEPAKASAARDVKAELLKIVSERTGYAVEMLDLAAAIESDLGIDSIKRVEILNAFQRLFTPSEQTAIQGMMDKLTSARTLADMLQPLSAALAPPEAASPPATPRLVMTVADLPAAGEARKYPGRVSIITDDETGLAASLANAWRQAGETVVLLRHGRGPVRAEDGAITADLTDPGAIETVVRGVRADYGPVGAIVHLLPVRVHPASVLHGGALADWREHIQEEVKSLYALVRAAGPDLTAAGREKGALLAVVTGRGGDFGASARSACPAHWGAADFVKTAAVELPEAACKIVDLDVAEKPGTLGRKLIAELSCPGDVMQVGLSGGRRVRVAVQPAKYPEKPARAIGRDWVFLLTGGARGITADIAVELARRFQPTIFLAGMSAAPPPEDPRDVAEIADSAKLKAALAARLRQTSVAVRPADVENAFRRLMKDREIRKTLEAIRGAGAQVEYVSVDVRQEEAVAKLLAGIYGRQGRLDCVIHGAGIIEDKLIRDKTPESFDRVVHTKADSVFLLARHLKPDKLRCLVLMSSVTAAFGNRGQADYGAANGILNGAAVSLAAAWPCHVAAMNWGPWGPAESSGGMVTDEVRRQFESRGIQLIPRAEGVAALLDEVERGSRNTVLTVIGGGPWGETHAERAHA
ncbi:MAG: SDR family oxidoreductase [Bryobacteraceae bacterium]